jgi:hypothetical protein
VHSAYLPTHACKLNNTSLGCYFPTFVIYLFPRELLTENPAVQPAIESKISGSRELAPAGHQFPSSNQLHVNLTISYLTRPPQEGFGPANSQNESRNPRLLLRSIYTLPYLLVHNPFCPDTPADSVKRKYFRIENNRTAPEQAAWSEKNVKRRAVEEREGERKRERLRKEACRVKRARVRGVPLMGGLLGREVGERAAEAVVTRAWVGGLREKGAVALWPFLCIEPERGLVLSMWVGNHEPSGLGFVYATFAGTHLAASYIPRDADDR